MVSEKSTQSFPPILKHHDEISKVLKLLIILRDFADTERSGTLNPLDFDPLLKSRLF